MNRSGVWTRLKAAWGRLRRGGLGARIVWWSFLPTALILAAVAGAAFISYLQAAEDLAVEQNRDLSHYAAGQLSGEMEEYSTTLEEIARLANLGQLELDRWKMALEQQANRLVVFDGGALALDSEGTMIASQPMRPDLQLANLSDRPYFRGLMRGSEPVITGALREGPQGKAVIAIAVPIRGLGETTRGVLVGMFRLGETAVSAFYGDILKLRAGGEGRVYLVDGGGQVLFHSNPERILSDRWDSFVVRQALAGESGAARTIDERGLDVLASYAPVPGTDWAMVVEKDWSQVVAPIRSRELLLVVLLVLGVLVPGAIVSIGVRAITRPIVDLVEAAENIARGEYARQAPAEAGGELGELATQFNRVAVQLKEAQEDLGRKVEARTHELSMLLDAVQGASGSLDLEQVLEEISESLAEAAGVPNCGIFLMDEASELFYPAGTPQISAHGITASGLMSQPVDPEQDTIARRVIATGRPAVGVTGDVELAGRSGLQSILEIPLVSKGSVVALAILGTEDPGHEFAPEGVDLARGIASTAAVAIENARLFERLEQKLRELESVYQADEELHRHLDLDGVLQSLVDVSVDILEADKSSIMVWDEGEGALKVRAARGFSRETMARMTFHAGEGAVSRVISGRQAALVEDTHADEGVARYVTDPEGIRAFIHIPIEIGDRFFGVFNLNYLEPRKFPEEEVRLFTSLAQRAALAIENARLYDRSQELAVAEERGRLARDLHDAVTQTLFSASIIAEVIPRIWERDQDEGRRQLEDLRQLTRGALAEMRTLLLELRPATLTEMELGDLLSQLTEALTSRAGVEVAYHTEGSCPLPQDIQVAIYRIAQEAFNNVAKHAEATEVAVELVCDEEKGLSLVVRDNGKGFEAHSAGADRLGLDIMKERADEIGADLEVRSRPGAGTEVSLRWKPAGNGRWADG